MEDAALGNHEDQPGLVGCDLAERRKNVVFCKDNELGEIAFNQDAFHRARLNPRVQSSADITPDLDTIGSAKSFAARGFGTTRLRRDALPLGAVGDRKSVV